MNPASIILFFFLVTVIGIAGLSLIGFGLMRLKQETVTHTGAGKSTMIRCCGIDLLIALAGLGLTSFGAFSAYRIILG